MDAKPSRPITLKNSEKPEMSLTLNQNQNQNQNRNQNKILESLLEFHKRPYRPSETMFYNPRLCAVCKWPILKRKTQSWKRYIQTEYCCVSCKVKEQHQRVQYCNICYQAIPGCKVTLKQHKYEVHAFD
jgi:hypothetical protein